MFIENRNYPHTKLERLLDCSGILFEFCDYIRIILLKFLRLRVKINFTLLNLILLCAWMSVIKDFQEKSVQRDQKLFFVKSFIDGALL